MLDTAHGTFVVPLMTDSKISVTSDAAERKLGDELKDVGFGRTGPSGLQVRPAAMGNPRARIT